ncbi:MAG: cupin domain-containing protein [Candidatus Latescibacteria bacterium]|nr:cupin domain-containing protein [Candidatus Latescibacterota bacterium]
MPFAQVRRDNMEELDKVHAGAGPILFGRVFERDDFGTDWKFIHASYLLPGGGIGHHRHDYSEEIFVTLDNAAQFTHNGRTTQIEGGAAVPLRQGESHAIYNHTDTDTRWFNFNVGMAGGKSGSTDHGDDRKGAPLESADRLPVGRFDRSLLTYGPSHDGKGEIGARMIWGSQDFQSNFGFLGHALLPPGTSVGYHRHERMEECYVIAQGSGRMTEDGETREVFAGDVILNKLGSSHGIYNHTTEELELVVVAVTVEKGIFDATNLGNDLSGR